MRKKWILTIVLLSYLVTAIDASIVTTGLTMIKSDLHLTQVSLSWIQNAYLLAFGGMVLLGGRLGDLFGRKQIFISALTLFGIGSLLAAIAQTAMIMISARFIQGIGAALLAPTSLALLMDTFSGSELTKAIAWYSSVSGIGTSIGMILGGILASTLSWRYGFSINVPLAIFMIIVALKELDWAKIDKISFDAFGGLLSILALFSLVYTINGAHNVILFGIITLILFISFILVESKRKNPMLPLRLFSDWSRSSAYLVRALFVGSMMGYFLFTSEYLQTTHHFSPLKTGFAFVPLTFVTFLAALRVPDSVLKSGNRSVMLVGMGFLISGFILTIALSGTQNYWLVVGLPMILLGLGQGFAMSPLTNLGIQNVDTKDSGAASGLVNAAHQVGGSIGLSVMVTLTSGISSMAGMFQKAMIIGLIINILGFFLGWFTKRND